MTPYLCVWGGVVLLLEAIDYQTKCPESDVRYLSFELLLFVVQETPKTIQANPIALG